MENSFVVVGCSRFYLTTLEFSFLVLLLPFYCTATKRKVGQKKPAPSGNPAMRAKGENAEINR